MQCGEGKEEQCGQGGRPSPYCSFPGPEASTIQNPGTPCVGEDSSSYLSRLLLVKQWILWLPTCWTFRRLDLSPTESSYKFLLSWMSGRFFLGGLLLPLSSQPPTPILTPSSSHPWLPKSPSELLYSRRKGIDGLNIPSLPPSSLLQMRPEELRFYKDTREQMMCGSTQSSAFHIYVFSMPAHFIVNRW